MLKPHHEECKGSVQKAVGILLFELFYSTIKDLTKCQLFFLPLFLVFQTITSWPCIYLGYLHVPQL